MIVIRQYSPSEAPQWDQFVRLSRNGTLLHMRGYMDYHSHRFADCSLLAYHRSDAGAERLVALLPANVANGILYSHQGLTYGGWILPYRHLDAAMMLEVWQALAAWMAKHAITTLVYKPVPHIYHRYPADDDLYGLWRLGAQISVAQVSEAIYLPEPIAYNENNRRGAKYAQAHGVHVARSTEFAAFWQLLADTLMREHQVAPVHSSDELLLLAGRFPEQIELWAAFAADGEIVAGTVVYISATCAHAQYIAASPRGRQLKALPLLFQEAIANYRQRGLRYFDFGTCNEDAGRILNAGLAAQKTGLGARPISYTTYTLQV